LSDSYLRYVPIDPTFRPSTAAANASQELLARLLPDAEDITFELLEDVEFIDAGSNWSGVHCPSCNADIESWWEDAMSTAAEHRFEKLAVCTPCCNTHTSLDKLKYVWPVAFGRFVLEATNPNSKGLSERQLANLAETLQCQVHEVAAHV
jgi:hypothetical protein